ncbi:MAG: hypothetical protein CSB13_00735 [Chloroflexi bacterium]|nr:MAG: hypothetical protein CSB13_00735 [Chloroflexota bacterium]
MIQKQKRRAAIQRQIKRVDNQLSDWQRISDQLMRLRLTVFLVGVITAVIVLFQWGVWYWFGVSVVVIVAFSLTVKWHRHVETSMSRFRIWRQIKQTHLARMNLSWADLPTPADFDLPPAHPFALDLDLVGERSVLQLVDTAVSVEGSKRLAGWLLETEPDLEMTRSRQAAVADLAKMTLFRDKLSLHSALATEAMGEKWPGRRVLLWLDSQNDGQSLGTVLWLLAGLSLVNISLLLLYLAGYVPPLFLVSWALYGVIFALRSGDAAPIFEDAYFLEKSLRRLGVVFRFLETARLGESDRVRTVCAPFLDEVERPSAYLRRITKLLTLAGLRQNPFLWLLLNGLVPWDIFVSEQLHGCKQELQTRLPVWLDAWCELEALCSLATLAYLNPETIFPTMALAAERPFFTKAIGHPLLLDETRICNDFQIDELGAVDIVTGSNMAGKSSFLRTLGVNFCLAYAGGPVFAQQFETRLFRIYTSIRVADSVTDGFSYFYAEVRRLAGLLTALSKDDERPLFFLIDEIFRGTNNRERLVGSQAYIKALVGQPGVGLIATHDLELVKLADARPLVRNFHFRDGVENGRMTFDYILHPGPCPTTNALKIMELAGLPVESPSVL